MKRSLSVLTALILLVPAYSTLALADENGGGSERSIVIDDDDRSPEVSSSDVAHDPVVAVDAKALEVGTDFALDKGAEQAIEAATDSSSAGAVGGPLLAAGVRMASEPGSPSATTDAVSQGVIGAAGAALTLAVPEVAIPVKVVSDLAKPTDLASESEEMRQEAKAMRANIEEHGTSDFVPPDLPSSPELAPQDVTNPLVIEPVAPSGGVDEPLVIERLPSEPSGAEAGCDDCGGGADSE